MGIKKLFQTRKYLLNLAGGKETLKSKKKISWSIYSGKTGGEEARGWIKLHQFKYFLMLPLLKLVKKYVKPVAIKDEPHNRNLLLFNEVFERTIIDWTMLYQRGNEIHSNQLQREPLNKHLFAASQNILRDMKLLMFQIMMKDTAYREFFNILVYNMALYTNEMYDGEKVEHLFYNRETSMDLTYKSWWDKQPTFLHKINKKWLKQKKRSV